MYIVKAFELVFMEFVMKEHLLMQEQYMLMFDVNETSIMIFNLTI